jgi:hypothetical protein
MADSAAQFRPAPGTPLVDIPNLMGAIGIADTKARETAVQLQEASRKQGENTAAQAAASRAGTLNQQFETPESILFQDNQQLKADTYKQQALAEAVGSADGSVNVMNILIQDIRNTGMKMRQVGTKLAEDKAVSLWDDPLTAIANAFTIPWTEQELDGLAKTQADSRKTLNDLTASVTNVAAAAEAGKAKVSAATIADRQRAIAADQTRQALQIEALGLKDGIAHIKDVQQADATALDRVRIATAFYNDTRTQARADEHLKMAREAQVWQRKQAEDLAKARGDKAMQDKIQRDADEEMFMLANRTRLNDGLPLYGSVGELKSKMTTTAKQKAEIEDFVERGRRLTDPKTAQTYRFGGSATEAMQYLINNQLEPTTKQQQQFVDVLRTAAAEEKKVKDSKGTMGSMTFARDYVKANYENYKPGDGSNPNAPVTYEALMADPVLSRNPIFQKVIAPLITDGNRKTSAEPDQVFAMLTAASINDPRAVNPAAASALIKYMYDKSTELNNKNTQVFKYLGYQPERLVTTVHVGMQPILKGAADLTTAAGAAMLATGVGVVPGAAVSAIGLGAEAYAFSTQSRKVDLSDVNQIQLAYTSKIRSQLGLAFNNEGTFPNGVPRNAQGKWTGEGPPLLRSGVITGTK